MLYTDTDTLWQCVLLELLIHRKQIIVYTMTYYFVHVAHHPYIYLKHNSIKKCIQYSQMFLARTLHRTVKF